jgi:hypothetical protein
LIAPSEGSARVSGLLALVVRSEAGHERVDVVRIHRGQEPIHDLSHANLSFFSGALQAFRLPAPSGLASDVLHSSCATGTEKFLVVALTLDPRTPMR